VLKWPFLGLDATLPLRWTVSERKMVRAQGLFVAAAVLLLAGALNAQTRPATTQPASVTATVISAPTGAGYIGAERCRSCHKTESTEFGKTAHAALREHQGAAVGCENCHGPGKPHAEA